MFGAEHDPDRSQANDPFPFTRGWTRIVSGPGRKSLAQDIQSESPSNFRFSHQDGAATTNNHGGC
jgi:hypothetical protein